jgi:hypothetical protein
MTEENKEVLVPEVVEEDTEKNLVAAANEQARAPARIKQLKDIDPQFLERLEKRGDLSSYIMERVMDNVNNAEELLASLQKALGQGLISEKMFESGAKLVDSISKLLDQANKVKAQEEKFSVEAERVWVEKMRMVYGKSDVPEPPENMRPNVLIMTREALLEKIAEKGL